tara:strand:- start:16545 stop:16970 length:426 start_codon:yes stop_codon:yes gene_type:complete
MSSFKFQVGEPRKVTLSFDQPKTGKNEYGMWYLYGIKSDINSDEDSFFATATLHSMIQTLGAKEGDDLTIEKCIDGDMSFFKVNGLSINDMNSGGSQEKISEAQEKSGISSVDQLKARIKELELEIASLKKNQLTEDDIPF